MCVFDQKSKKNHKNHLNMCKNEGRYYKTYENQNNLHTNCGCVGYALRGIQWRYNGRHAE